MIGDFKMIGLCITLALIIVGFLSGWFCKKIVHGVPAFQTSLGAGVLLGLLALFMSGTISWFVLSIKSAL